MRIRNNRLYGDDNRAVPFRQANSMGGNVRQEYLIMHYTADGSASGTVNFFANDAPASAHLVIGRDGSIVQMVRFDRVAHHAGRSTWANRSRLNPYSIGIELSNWGLLEESGGTYRSWTGRAVPSGLVIRAPHKHSPTVQRHWETFTEIQMEAAAAAAAAIVREFQIPAANILGHDDISPGRKIDPGPAFNMASFKARVAGREDDTELDSINYTVVSTTGLKLRQGPGTEHEIIKDMPDGTIVHRMVGMEFGRWWFVTALDANGNEDVSGYAHSNWLVAS